jgi:viologen exporter family transport system permease protein
MTHAPGRIADHREKQKFPLRKYLKVFDIGLQNTFVYRWNFLFRSLFGVFPLLGTVFIWGAIFEAKGGGINNFDYASVVYYFLLVLVLDSLITPGDDEWQVAADIRDGQMNSFLIKPVNYLVYRWALFVSNRLLYTLVTLPVVIVIFAVFHRYLAWPSSWAVWLLTLISVIQAGLIQFLIAYSVALIAFWMLEISTVVFIIYSFEYFLSGHMFPIGFMPPSVQAILKFLPFPYELYFPIAIFMGQVHGAELWQGLLIQFCWLLIIALAANTLWQQGLKRYQAVGG